MSDDPKLAARLAAARAAADRIEPGSTIGLGSGRAVWAVIDELASRRDGGSPVRVAVASSATDERARAAGIEVVELDGERRLSLAIDGADEVDADLGLLKGGGGALLREKIVIAAADRFVVVAETAKRVERLGRSFPLPVEVVRFAWRDTRRRVLELVETAEPRLPNPDLPGGEADGLYLTDEGHHILDCRVRAEGEVVDLARALDGTPGVVDHGLFLAMADEVLLGTPDGNVEILSR